MLAQKTNEVTYEQIKNIVIEMLKGYKKIPALISSAERKANGYVKPVGKEQLDALVVTGKAYTENVEIPEFVHREKAENLFYSFCAVNRDDEEKLDKIRELLIGRRVWGFNGYYWEGKVISREKYLQQWEETMKEINFLQDMVYAIDETLSSLKSYAPQLEQLLRNRYIEGKSVFVSRGELNISEKTHDRWKKEAISEFAKLIGVM